MDRKDSEELQELSIRDKLQSEQIEKKDELIKDLNMKIEKDGSDITNLKDKEN